MAHTAKRKYMISIDIAAYWKKNLPPLEVGTART